ncbi:MAG: lamin tail domain-containing protein [Rubrivivax sp.]|nr:lamin tail domain-containing protein [Rubrivivax sp.]
MNRFPLSLLFAAACVSTGAQAQVQITEWMYNGNGPTGEYVEFTNLGSTSVDFTGWSFDDDSRVAGTVSLSAIGVLAPGASALITEGSEADFRAVWGLGAGVALVGSNITNLGRADEINLFDASGTLVDRFAYGDVAFPGTVRAQNASGNPLTLADLDPFTVTPGWVLATVGDSFGSYASTLGDVGNPGSFASVPEPGTWALLLAGIAVVGGVARRQQRHARAQA